VIGSVKNEGKGTKESITGKGGYDYKR